MIQLLVSRSHKSSFFLFIFNRTEIHHYDDYTNFDDYGAWSTSHDDFFDEAMSGSSSTRSYNSGSNNGVGARVGGGNNGKNNETGWKTKRLPKQ